MKIQTDELERQSVELRRLTSRMSDISETVRRVSRMLSRERFGEEFRPSLQSVERGISERAEEISILSNALSQISQMYEQTELRIMDEAEHAHVHFPHATVAWQLIDVLRTPDQSMTDRLTRLVGGAIDWTPWEP